MKYEIGSKYQGFILKEEREVTDISSICRLFEHEKTGARLLYVSNDDENKVFCIGFKTPPEDDTGLPHILEHSVLCGSRKFPIKEPFVELLKSSQNTFLNAMTFSDKTIYPVASMNDKDLMNLMDVYMDAVFYPNIYNKKEIFMQEGWHYELNNVEDELTYKGVVYNEMKGAFSSPEGVLFRRCLNSLFPDTCYGYESGGDPEAITTLTYEKFLEFHKKYYHPTNSYIYLYGNGDIDQHLKFINEEYLAAFDKNEVDSSIKLQVGFDERKDYEYEYPIAKDESEKFKSYFGLNIACGNALNRELITALEIIGDVLMSNTSSPLKEALLKTGIAKDFIVFSSDDPSLQPTFGIYAFEADYKSKDKFLKTIKQTLESIVEKGLDIDLVEGAINKKEFILREANSGGTPKGLVYGEEALKTWLYEGNPMDALEYSKVLNIIKEKYKQGYLEKIIKEYILNNTHSTFVMLKPKKGLSEEKQAKDKEKMSKIKNELSKEQVENLVHETNRLLELQDEPDKKEDILKIPRLKIEDVKKESEWTELEKRSYDGHEVLYYPHKTNEIMYITLKFDLRTVDKELIPYISILEGVLAELSTRKYKYDELSKDIDKNIGGIRINTRNAINIEQPYKYDPQLLVEIKGLVPRTKEMLEILNEIINHTVFTEMDKIHEIIKMLISRIKASMMQNGHKVAVDKLLASFLEYAKYNEYSSGLEFYKFLVGLDEGFNKKCKEIQANLQKVRDLIFNKKSMSMLVVCDEEHYKIFEENINTVISDLNDENLERKQYNFELKKENLGLATQADIQYVAKGYNMRELGDYEPTGQQAVLNSILKYNYLWNEVRVKGGAYGCMVNSSSIGYFIVASYRDPNLKKTIDTYNKVYEYIEKMDIDQDELEKYIISTIGEVDRPYPTPYRKAYSAESRLVAGITKEFDQKIRTEILETNVEKLRKFSNTIKQVMEKDYICVVGNETIIKENAELFDKIESIQ